MVNFLRHHGWPQAWARKGHFPLEMCKVFCALAVTVKRSATTYLCIIFTIFRWRGRLGESEGFMLWPVFRGRRLKRRSLTFLRKSALPQIKSWLLLWICPSLENILQAPMWDTVYNIYPMSDRQHRTTRPYKLYSQVLVMARRMWMLDDCSCRLPLYIQRILL